ncbi:MAG TPA: tetratricopeptide repeat protein [Firmicutes bacterium]|nr:tetratricopeptide repeat protein [Bacillota bacterium]
MRRSGLIVGVIVVLLSLSCSTLSAQGLSSAQWAQVQSEVEQLGLGYFGELGLWQSVVSTLEAVLGDVEQPNVPQGVITDIVSAALENGYSAGVAGRIAANLIAASQRGRNQDVEILIKELIDQDLSANVIVQVSSVLGQAGVNAQSAQDMGTVASSLGTMVAHMAEGGYSEENMLNVLGLVERAAALGDSNQLVQSIAGVQEILTQVEALGVDQRVLNATTQALYQAALKSGSIDELQSHSATIAGLLSSGADLGVSDAALENLMSALQGAIAQSSGGTELEQLLSGVQRIFQNATELGLTGAEVNRTLSIVSGVLREGESVEQISTALNQLGDALGAGDSVDAIADLVLPQPPIPSDEDEEDEEEPTEPDEAEELLEAARLAREQGDYAEALSLYFRAFDLDPSLLDENRSEVGSLYADWAAELENENTLASLQEALAKLDGAIDIHPAGIGAYNAQKAGVYAKLGVLHFADGAYEQAVNAYSAALDLVDNTEYKVARGKVYAAWAADLFESGNYEAAIEKYKAAAEDDPSNAATYAKAQAECYFELAKGTSDLDEKIGYLTKAYGLDAQYGEALGFAYVERAAVELAAARYEDAYADLNEALTLIPEDKQDAGLWRLVAEAAKGVDKPAVAVEYLLRWLEADADATFEDYSEAYYYCVTTAGDLQSALTVAQWAAELFKDTLGSYQLLAGAYLLNDDIEAGISAYLDGLKLVIDGDDDAEIQSYIAECFRTLADVLVAYPDLGLEEQLVRDIGEVFMGALSESIDEMLAAYEVAETEFYDELLKVGISSAAAKEVVYACIDELLEQDLNAANIIPLLREMQFKMYDELLKLASTDADFKAAAEAVNEAIFKTLWVGEDSMGGRLQKIMDRTMTALKDITEETKVLNSAVAVSLVAELSDYIRMDLELEQAQLLIGAARHIIKVSDQIKKMPGAVEIALEEFRARAEQLELVGVATAFDEVLAEFGWKFDVNRRDWDWKALDEEEQAFLETFLKDPVGTLLILQRAMEERDDVNQLAAEAMALWNSVRTEILPDAIKQIPDFTVEEWNQAATALLEAFMSLITGKPIDRDHP